MREMQRLEVAELADCPFQVSVTRVLDAPLSAVFEELGDPSGWFPLMSSSVWNGRVGGVGSSRDVHVRTFGRFREEMLVWEPDRRVAFTMTQTSSPFVARMGEDYAISAVAGGTELRWRMVGHLTLAGRAIRPVLQLAVGRMAVLAAKRLARRARSHGTHAA